MKRTQEPQKKNYCFTYNNYTTDGEEKLKSCLADNKHADAEDNVAVYVLRESR